MPRVRTKEPAISAHCIPVFHCIFIIVTHFHGYLNHPAHPSLDLGQVAMHSDIKQLDKKISKAGALGVPEVHVTLSKEHVDDDSTFGNHPHWFC